MKGLKFGFGAAFLTSPRVGSFFQRDGHQADRPSEGWFRIRERGPYEHGGVSVTRVPKAVDVVCLKGKMAPLMCLRANY
jgi:hypothetical protein